jgi:hypothetical protein
MLRLFIGGGLLPFVLHLSAVRHGMQPLQSTLRWCVAALLLLCMTSWHDHVVTGGAVLDENL